MRVHCDAHKNERAISLARSRPLCSDFRRSGSGSRSQRLLSRIVWHPRAEPVFLPHSSMIPLAARAFLPPSVSSCLDRVSLPILEDVCQSALSFWKISPPLKTIVLSTKENASGSCNFLLWKWGYKKWKLRPIIAGQIRRHTIFRSRVHGAHRSLSCFQLWTPSTGLYGGSSCTGGRIVSCANFVVGEPG